MRLEVNGEPVVLSTAPATVRELLLQLRLVPETLLVEHNGTALHRSEWDTIRPEEGDRFELLRVVAGG